MRSHQRLLALGAVVTSSLLVAACAGGESPEPEKPTAEATADQSADATPEESAELPGDETTAPGTELAIGDTAILAHPIDGDDDETALLAATVNEIEAGTVDQLAEFELGERADGLEPYYLRITVAGVDESSAALAGTLLSNAFAGIAADGPVSNLNVIGTWEVCDISSLETGWSAESSQEICIIALAPEGSPVDAVQYSPRDEDYRGNPVIWKS